MSKLFNFILFLFFQDIVKSNNADENKYSFQLYPSWGQNTPYIFYAQANNELITINSTEGENCNIIERKEIEEYSYKDLSSVNIIDDNYLVKSCFGPDKLVEIIYINKETFIHNNNNLKNIMFCYSTKVYNPLNNKEHSDEYVIITYWTEIKSITDRVRYSHKCILFYPESKTFSQELTLTSGSQFVINIYYPEKCVTFRNTDIYCVIHYVPAENDEIHILGNNFVIETKNIILDSIYHQIESVNLVISNSQISSTVYQRPISLKKTSNSKLGFIDIYMTEYHHSEGKGKVSLMYSYYRKFFHTSYIPFTSNIFIGINIEDNYVHQDLFNYLVPNEDELIIIYISNEDKTSLILNRFNASDSSSKQLNRGFKNYAYNNYIRTDICSKPQYLQSIYINSFISYDDKDKNIINSNPNINYYKYQKDIGVLISCENNKNEVEYESKRIKLPQCLNILDEINGNDKHILKFGENENEIIFDIYNDPNLASLRNTSIIFYRSEIFQIYIKIEIKLNGLDDFKNIVYNTTITGLTHIKFSKTEYFNNLRISKSFTLSYRLKKNEIINGISSNIISDICNIEVSPGEKCTIDNCFICKDNTHCSECESLIKGMALDSVIYSETYGQCVCNEERNFKKEPLIIENNKVCACKDNYVYYKDKSTCISKDSNKTLPIVQNGIDELTGIIIFDDCYPTCKKCSQSSVSDSAQYCTKCKDEFILKGINCVPKDNPPTIPITTPPQETCFEEKKVWFELGKFKFNYLKMDKCVFIFYEDQLFFISNKTKCQGIYSQYSSVISQCLTKSNNIKNKDDYLNLLNSIHEYNGTDDKITIIKQVKDEDREIFFHLVNLKTNAKDARFSNLYFANNEIYDVIVFKADIKRPDIKSTQVEYQFYESDDENIYKKVSKSELKKYKITKDNKRRRLDEDEDDIEDDIKIILELPVTWDEGQLDKIKDLNNSGIDAFNQSSEFYLNVCYKYTTLDNKDIYLQDRKEQYYPGDKFCEENCIFQKIADYETGKVRCECPFKEISNDYKNIKFGELEKDEKFNKKFTNPHYKVIGCPNWSESLGKNFGFYFTFISLLAFVALCGIRIYFLCYLKKNDVKKELNSFLEEMYPEKEESKIDKNSEDSNKEKENIFQSNEEEKNLKHSDSSDDYEEKKEEQPVKGGQKEELNGNSNPSSIQSNELSSERNIPTKSLDSSSKSENVSNLINKKDEKLTLADNKNDIQGSEDTKVINEMNNNEKSVENSNNDQSQIQKDLENKNDKEKEKEDLSQNININAEIEKEKNKEKENKSNLIDESKDENNNSKNLIENSEHSIEVQKEEKNNDENKDNDIDKKEPKTEQLKESLQKSLLKNSVNKFINNHHKNTKVQNNNKEGNENSENKDKEDKNNNKLLFSYEDGKPINVDEYDKDDLSIMKNESIKPKESFSKDIDDIIQNTSQTNIIHKSTDNKEDDNSKKKEEKEISIIEQVNDDNDNSNEDNLDSINLGNEDLISEKKSNDELISSQSQDSESKHNVMVNQMVPPPSVKKKKKKKKKKKNVKNVANPPQKDNDIPINGDSDRVPIDNGSNEINQDNDTNNKKDIKIDIIDREKEKKFSDYYDYLLDRRSYDYLIKNIKKEKLRDNRSFFGMLCSVIKSNSTLLYLFYFKIDDIYIKISILILCLNLYVFVTASLHFKMKMVLLYSNFNFGNLFLFGIISILVSFPIILCKKFLSVYNLFYEIFSEHINYIYREEEKEIKSSKHSISNSRMSLKTSTTVILENKKNAIKNKISKYGNRHKCEIIIYAIFGSVFLLINTVFITSYCGIYPNSVKPLVINIIFSIFMSCILICIFYSIGVALRYFGLKQKKKLMYNVSRFFNILNLTWNDFKEIIKCEKKEEDNSKNIKERPDDENP